ncbi:IS1595 family transposase [Candidatus Poribacteria bacterium]|nr:IS1595 family transposase [Candidatus Poribacteria bacterium]
MGYTYFSDLIIWCKKISKKASPDKSYRNGLSLVELFKKFTNVEAAEDWFIEARWGGKVECPKCGSRNIQDNTTHPHMRFRCRKCRKFFSTKTGTVMESSKLGYQHWAIAIFQMTTNLKGVSSMDLARDLEIQQKYAWHLAHKIRETFNDNDSVLIGKIGVDETYVGGLEENKHADKKLNAGRGGVGKAIVAGMKERESNQLIAQVVENTKRSTLHGFIHDNVQQDSEVFTNDLARYESLVDFDHKVEKHSVGEYVKKQAYINGMESFWTTLKRVHKVVFHKVSLKLLNRYVQEFAGRHNIRRKDTEDQKASFASGMVGKQLTYKELAK